MASRGRRNKVGLGRMDAALDAMTGLGFPKEVVRRKVKQLLKVYDGDAGWPFIEEGSYKLLIDSILEDQEESQEEMAPPPPKKDGASQDEVRDEDDAHPPSLAGPSTEAPNDDVPYAAGSGGGVNDVAGSSAACPPSGVHEASPKIVRNELQTNRKASVEEEGRSCWRDIALDTHSSISHMDNNTGNSPTKPTPSQEPMADLPKRKRKPCYGWISDGDEETEVLDIPSLVLPFDTMVGRTERSKKRKSRWDERPSDL